MGVILNFLLDLAGVLLALLLITILVYVIACIVVIGAKTIKKEGENHDRTE